MAADARCWDQHRDRQARSYLCIIPTCNLRPSLFSDAERCLALQPLRLRETLGRGLRWRCQRRQCRGWCVDCYEVDQARQVLIVQGDQRAPRFVCDRRIDRISATQTILRGQSEGVERTHQSKTLTVTCGSRLRAIANAWACPGAWRVRLLAQIGRASCREREEVWGSGR